MQRVLTAKGAETRRRILEGAAELLRTNGTAGVSLERICTSTGASKSQLFHYFPDGRSELFAAIARFEADRVIADQQPYIEDLSTPESWRAWRAAVIARYSELGRYCPVTALVVEISRTGPEAEGIVVDMQTRWHALMTRAVARLWSSGGGGDVAPEAAASVVLAAVQGGASMYQSTGEFVHLERALDGVLAYVGVA
ncbi:regulatory protein TetR [Pseudonocardia dioxanivorans CB1190]|uniref:Regulatory protein TetR n=1 Tax=Pseudonocardia dioxanivorans (strain ATCC 55486 / DSM 44775 / JCM 13855 / CB1190) TaxID=675635 RepID=F4CT80_PSEUX|nr:TetR/AcrR family transcriptional regulator [Pseudonocardia dioxanivorans]AEA26298.1 regulatory protein TetR [Pseudonocardia dioxanivorans CB1190]